MENQKVHWKKNFDPNWIGTHILPEGKPIIVHLRCVEWNDKAKVMGQTKAGYVATFEPNEYFNKPMLVNKTNCKRLTQLTNSPYPQDWKDLHLTLQQEMSKMPDGTQDYALRISSVKPNLVKKDYSAFESKLKECKNLVELQEVFLSFSADEKAATTKIKDELKTKLK